MHARSVGRMIEIAIELKWLLRSAFVRQFIGRFDVGNLLRYHVRYMQLTIELCFLACSTPLQNIFRCTAVLLGIWFYLNC